LVTNADWTLVWNGENRLISMESSASVPLVDRKKLEFAYDYMGRRISKKVYAGSTGSWVLTKHERFVYDGYKLIEKLDALNSNAILQQYIWNGETLLGIIDAASSKIHYPLTDANKNISDIIDASGTLTAHYEYSPFGQITLSSGTFAQTNPFRFSSEYFDSETGFVYYNFRYYSPELARWLSKDPIEEKGGLNLYVFVGNDGIGQWDLLGLGYWDHFPNGGAGYTHHTATTQGITSGSSSDSGSSFSSSSGSSKGSGGSALQAIVALFPEVGASVDKSFSPLLVGSIGPLTVYMNGGVSGKAIRCKNKDGTCGAMFVGSVYLVIDAGVGGPPSGAIKKGTFKSGPRKGQPYFKNIVNGQFADPTQTSSSVGVSAGTTIPMCEDSFDFSGTLKAYIAASYIAGTSTVNGNIGTCSLVSGCHWDLSLDVHHKLGFSKPALRAGIEFSASAEIKKIIKL